MLVRRIRYWLHEWKLVSYYNFSKYELFTLDNGMYYVQLLERYSRKGLYQKRRDKTFDFMQIGEDEFESYENNLP